ncbi:MAG: beta-N-acetylhexosaminidase [Alphaproteobacteria bacterium]|nr:MAG: beta-N-acetylhexosaminidase [Alphaproteobacteria bacterium]
MTKLKQLLALSAFAAAAVPAAASVTQTDLDRLAAGTDVRFTVVANKPDKCPSGEPNCFLAELRIKLPDRLPAKFEADDLNLYLSLVTTPQQVDSDQFELVGINGDLHVLRAKKGVRLEGGRNYTVRIWGSGHFYSTYYVMPNLYLAADGLGARTIEATRPVLDPETGLETLPFVAPMTEEAKLAVGSPGDETRWLTPERAFARYADHGGTPTKPDVVILPTPVKAARLPGAPLDLRRGVRLVAGDRAPLQTALNQLVASGVGGLSSGPELRVETGAATRLTPEAYRITANAAGIRIRAGSPAGAALALRSLAQQVAWEGGRLRPLSVEDSPRFPFRGLHVDVARNFHSKEALLKLVEQMAVYKLNRLHLHLGDDEGWRLEIKALPELTEVGGFRCHDPSETRCLLPQLGAGPEGRGPVNGYLSQADYLDILAAAKARNIEVIPSFDMPGHSRAAMRSMEARYRRLVAEGRPAEAELYRLVEPGDTTVYRSVQNYSDNTLNVCRESTYRFIDTVIGEVAALHAAAGTPLKTYHIGADETAGAWTQSPACKALMASTGRTAKDLGPMFIERVAKSLDSKGIEVAGWSDGLGHVDPKKMPRAVQSNIWGGLFGGGVAEAYDHANRGWRAVISMPTVAYFDSPYAPDALERGYDWPSRDTDSFKVFAFMPENLAANASVMTDLASRGQTLADPTPLAPGRRIEGLQAQLWSETVRSDDQAEYMLFPRLLALAERAWHRGAWEPDYKAGTSYSFGDGKVDRAALVRDWQSFAGRVGAQLRALDREGIDYRLAPPGARIVGGTLSANAEFPGMPIEYRDGDGPWRTYTGPVAVTGDVQLRTRSPDTRRASRIVTVER